MINLKLKSGYVALITMLVIGAVGLTIAVSLLLLSTSSIRTSFAEEQSAQARNLANSCSQEALARIKMSSSFTGSRTLNLGNGSCVYTISDLGGGQRQIVSSGTAGTVVRKNKVTISAVTPKITISSWQEVGDF